MSSENRKPAGGHATPLLLELKDAGLPLPPLLEMALADTKGVCPPVAIGTREALGAWADEHGYAAEQKDMLLKALMKIVRAPAYSTALAADESYRLDLDGRVVEPVSDLHRLSAAVEALARAARSPGGPPVKPGDGQKNAGDVGKKGAGAQPVEGQKAAGDERARKLETAKQGAAVVVQRMRGRLSAEEIARRAAALRSAAGK